MTVGVQQGHSLHHFLTTWGRLSCVSTAQSPPHWLVPQAGGPGLQSPAEPSPRCRKEPHPGVSGPGLSPQRGNTCPGPGVGPGLQAAGEDPDLIPTGGLEPAARDTGGPASWALPLIYSENESHTEAEVPPTRGRRSWETSLGTKGEVGPSG